MRNFFPILLICGLAVLPYGSVRSQSIQSAKDTLVDVFPLGVGNQWIYRYYSVRVYWPSGNPGTITTDSGRVVYTISGRTASDDSTSWLIYATRDLTRHMVISSFSEPDRDTTFPIRDTSYFDLVESHKGPHQVYRNAEPYLIRLDVFPFTRDYLDTTMICRFRTVGEGDSTTFLSWITPPPAFNWVSTFTFLKGIGLIRNSYNSGTVDVSQENEHFLLGATITSIPRAIGGPEPSSIFFHQNYPNPFNSMTTIRYGVPGSSIVRLSVFDLLGRDVALLVNERRDAGIYEVRFDGSGLASGVYLYRLTAGSFTQTRKLVLLR